MTRVKRPSSGKGLLSRLSLHFGAGPSTAASRPEVREAYRKLVAQGWVDAVRAMHPTERVYTFWKYLRNAFERDAGLRIDHFLLSRSLATRLTRAGVDRDMRGWEKASDHAPVWITLAD